LIELPSEKQNQESLNNAIQTLDQLVKSHSTPKNIKNNITGMISELQSNEYSISVRAANLIGTLDDITQDPNIPSYIRTSLWQVVSVLESIRE